MKFILLIFLAILLESYVVDSKASGYYWRDYHGKIPDDAFPGGSDVNGEPIYIGQSFGQHIIPSKIYGSNKKVYYEFNHSEHEPTNRVMILCTQHPEQLEWILADNSKIKVLTYAYLIVGGFQPEYITYIGRARSGAEVLVGKVLTGYHTDDHHGLWTTANGSTVHFTEFEVLSFKRGLKIQYR